MTKKKDPSLLKKRGRPKIPIDYEKAEKLASRMCSYDEIASILGVNASTLERDPEFVRHHKKGMDSGRGILRSKQFELAISGNATMRIWLGKQYLGQRDKSDQEITGKDGTPLIPAHELPDTEVERRAREILAKRK